MASPFPFSSGQVLTAAELNAIGETIDFSGSLALTNWTLGNGTVNVCKYVRVQNLVFYYGQVTLGSTSTTSGDLRVNLPVTAAASFAQNAGLARLNDQGTAAYQGTCSFESTTLLNLLVMHETGSKVQIQNVSGTNPFTWSGAAGDSFIWQIVYEAA